MQVCLTAQAMTDSAGKAAGAQDMGVSAGDAVLLVAMCPQIQ